MPGLSSHPSCRRRDQLCSWSDGPVQAGLRNLRARSVHDALHAVSALWAFLAALISNRSARIFLILFGAAYLGDGIFGVFTGWGYLDFGIFTNAALGPEFSLLRIAANLPHIGLGAVALVAGLLRARSA